MKPHLLCVALALVTAVSARASYSFKESFDKSGPFSPTGTVILENVNGSVEVRASDRNEIRISGEKSAETEDELKAIDLTIDLGSDRTVVTVKLPKREGHWWSVGNRIHASVRFLVTVPAGARLERIQTVNGNMVVTGMHGYVSAASVNGKVSATVAGSHVHLQTVNGSVDARITSLPSGCDILAKTVNGSATIALPADAGASVEASTVNGGISCDFPLQVSGHIIGKHLNGVIGGGGSSVTAKSVNGGIHLRKI